MTVEQYNAMSGAQMAVYWVVCIILAVIGIIAMWKIFTKAGEKGWKDIIPIYDAYILYKITWGNGWFFLLLLRH